MTNTDTTYRSAVRSFDHTRLATMPSYQRLREALSDICNEAAGRQLGITLRDMLNATRDMTLTAPFGDCCQECYAVTFPHKLDRSGDWLFCTYQCPQHGVWTCGHSVTITEYEWWTP